MERPWMKFHTRDWLDNKELRRCSPLARSVLADLMSLAHEGTPYGCLSDQMGPLTDEYMASRCVIPIGKFRAAVMELKTAQRVHVEGAVLLIKRMVIDEDIRVRRAAGGSASIGHPHTHPSKQKEGYPLVANGGHPSFKIDSRARTPADSDSCVSFLEESKNTRIPKKQNVIEHPGAPTQEMDDQFDSLWSRWPRRFGKPSAAMDWVSLVTPGNAADVGACAERYLASDEVARGAVKNLGSTPQKTGWLVDCARDNWESDWPKAIKPAAKKSNFDLALEE